MAFPHLDIFVSLLTAVALSPLAAIACRRTVPFEVIVFSLLVAAYKGPQLFTATSGAVNQGCDSRRAGIDVAASEPDVKKNSSRGIFSSEESKIGKSRKVSEISLNMFGNKTPQMQWRSLINKFTPEKFDKLCEQLLASLPGAVDEFLQVLGDLLVMIFDAASRQHQYSEMYTSLCQKLVDSKQCSDQGKAFVWEHCQHSFQTKILQPPLIPGDLDEGEYLEKTTKHRHVMVGIVKFSGDLVRLGLVPCDGVIQLIHRLLQHEDRHGGIGCESLVKDVEQREVRLELLCALLSSMGSSFSDSNVWNKESMHAIEDVFTQLERLVIDTEHFSLRIRCLIQDVLDLRLAHWREKAGKLRPQKLEELRISDYNTNLDSPLHADAPEFAPGSSCWSSRRIAGRAPSRSWLDHRLLLAFQSVDHHLEVIDESGSNYRCRCDPKLKRLRALIQMYHSLQGQQFVVVAHLRNVKHVLDLIAASFPELHVKALDLHVSEVVRQKSIASFERGETAILVVATEVATRHDFGSPRASSVLVNFDFPTTVQRYLYRVFKRADISTQVYTFFSPQTDHRHMPTLIAAMQMAEQKVPLALLKLKDGVGRCEHASEKDQTKATTTVQAVSTTFGTADFGDGSQWQGCGEDWNEFEASLWPPYSIGAPSAWQAPWFYLEAVEQPHTAAAREVRRARACLPPFSPEFVCPTSPWS